mmetsp:Transcript_7894/g.15300  ORF Transcript_7894/g.15300 Transcript_7894/m.15300 type:complete len:381 (+) Transcript_7894:1030-2172(+)
MGNCCASVWLETKEGHSLSAVAEFYKLKETKVLDLIAVKTRLSVHKVKESLELIQAGTPLVLISKKLQVDIKKLKVYLPDFLTDSELAKLFDKQTKGFPRYTYDFIGTRYTVGLDYQLCSSISRLDLVTTQQIPFMTNAPLPRRFPYEGAYWTQDRQGKLYIILVAGSFTKPLIRLVSIDTMREFTVLEHPKPNFARNKIWSINLVHYSDTLYIFVSEPVDHKVWCLRYCTKSNTWKDLLSFDASILCDSAVVLESLHSMFMFGTDVTKTGDLYLTHPTVLVISLETFRYEQINLNVGFVHKSVVKSKVTCFSLNDNSVYFFFNKGLHHYDHFTYDATLLRKYKFDIRASQENPRLSYDTPCYLSRGKLYLEGFRFAKLI